MIENKFRLAVFGGEPSSPLSLSRVHGPLLAMSREDRRLEIVPPPPEIANEPNDDLRHGRLWPWLAGCDALFIEHAYTRGHVQMAVQAERLGVPVWLDWGDDLFNVDRSNPAWTSFTDLKSIRQHIGYLIQVASVVTTATETLRSIYRSVIPPEDDGLSQYIPFADKFRVLPEACQWAASEAPRKKVISWRGLASHADDLPQFAKELLDVLRDPLFKDWSLLLFGDPVIKQIAENELGDQGINLALAPWFETPWGMMHAWNGAAPYLHLVPLPDTPFNRPRPPSAWLEASAVGAATICPDHLPEWRVPGMIHYTDGVIHTNGKLTFADVLRRELARFEPVSVPSQSGELRGALHPNVRAAREYIYPEFTLKSVNRIRWEIINRLAGANTPKPKDPRDEIQPCGHRGLPSVHLSAKGKSQCTRCANEMRESEAVK